MEESETEGREMIHAAIIIGAGALVFYSGCVYMRAKQTKQRARAQRISQAIG